MWSGAHILHRPRCGFAECDGGVERPIGIAQHLAGEEDEVGITVGDEVVGLVWLGDHANGGCRNGGFGADAGSKRGLKSGADGDFGIRYKAAGRDVDEVHAVGAQVSGESDGVVDGPAAF